MLMVIRTLNIFYNGDGIVGWEVWALYLTLRLCQPKSTFKIFHLDFLTEFIISGPLMLFSEYYFSFKITVAS